MILELKDKFEEEDQAEGMISGQLLKDDKIFEVRQALKTLGYTAREINRSLSKLRPEDIKDSKVEDLLKAALKEV